MDFLKYTLRQHKPLPDLIISTLEKLRDADYSTWVDSIEGCLYVLIRLDKPHRYLRVAKFSPDDKTFEMYADDNPHPRALTTLHVVRKLLGVEQEISDDGSPF